MKKSLSLPAFILALICTSACNNQSSFPAADSEQASNARPLNNKNIAQSPEAESDVNTQNNVTMNDQQDIQWVSVNDMTENSFSLKMPGGWQNAALLHRLHTVPRSLVTAVAPDKNTVIYFGDPRIPVYAEPNPEMEYMYSSMGMKAPYIYTPYISAERYFSDYMQSRFGQLEGFRMIEKFDNKPLLEKQASDIAKFNLQSAKVSNVSYRFEYVSNGKTIKAVVNGVTWGIGGMWMADVSGYCTTGDTRAVEDIMITMMKTRENNPEWQRQQQAQQQAQHEQTMAMINQNTQRMTQQHQQNMANIQASANAHQQRMANLQQSHDQWNNNWQQNQNAIDDRHNQFINSINNEHTVADRSGNTYQVDNYSDKYFVDKTNNTYIGTHSTVTLDDLRKIKNLNIENFEQVQIIR
jgi:hypothetical protein